MEHVTTFLTVDYVLKTYIFMPRYLKPADLYIYKQFFQLQQHLYRKHHFLYQNNILSTTPSPPSPTSF